MKKIGVILAGGKSSRMGQDKAAILWRNKSLVAHIYEVLEILCEEVVIVSDNSAHEFLVPNAKRVADKEPNFGPVAAICSAMEACNADKYYIVSCDSPLINLAVFEQLEKKTIEVFEKKKEVDTVYFSVNGRDLPLIGIYTKRSQKAFQRALAEGQKRLFEVLAELDCEVIPANEQISPKLVNLNTSQDLCKLLTNDGV